MRRCKEVADKDKKKETETEKRDKQLRAKYEKEMENFERTSNTILDEVRKKGVSIHAPNPQETPKQRPEEISDIHILFSQQKPEYVKEGKDDSEEQEKKAKQGSTSDKDKDTDSKDKDK